MLSSHNSFPAAERHAAFGSRRRRSGGRRRVRRLAPGSAAPGAYARGASRRARAAGGRRAAACEAGGVVAAHSGDQVRLSAREACSAQLPALLAPARAGPCRTAPPLLAQMQTFQHPASILKNQSHSLASSIASRRSDQTSTRPCSPCTGCAAYPPGPVGSRPAAAHSAPRPRGAGCPGGRGGRDAGPPAA